MGKRIFLLVIFLCYCLKANCEFILSNRIISAYSLLIQLNITDAKTEIAADKLNYPMNSFHPLLENYIDFLKLMLEEDETYYKQKLGVRQGRIELLEAGGKSSPFYNYSLAEVYLQWAFIRMKFGDNLRAAYDLKKASSYIQRNQRKYPEFILNNKTAGLIHAMAGAVPASYSWLSNIAGIKGTVQQGLKELQALVDWLKTQPNFEFLIPELLFIQNFIQLNFDLEGFSLSQELKSEKFKTQPLLNFSMAVYYQKKRNSEMVLQYLERIPKSLNGIKFCYLNYVEAEAKQNLTLVEGDFDAFLNCHSGKNYLKSAIRKKAWSFLLRGNQLGYKLEIQKVLVKGSTDVDDDKQAQLEAQSGIQPNVDLLAARLRFDAGLNGEAISSLNRFDLKTAGLVNRTEYYYRLGRCLDAQKKDSLAILNYKIAIETGKDIHDYYAASACFYSGLIEERRRNYNKAVSYFKRVSTFPVHPYKTSLDAKAKAAMNRLAD